MADFKRKALVLASGKQIKLFGNSVAIGKNLQIGEGYAPNIFSCLEEQPESKTGFIVSNPYKLTVEEIHDLADYNIQLRMNLKSGTRKYGINDPKIFTMNSGT
jgi:hypothetical protein